MVRQDSTVRGSGNIIIQNTGDFANIVVGQTYLALTLPAMKAPLGAINSDIDLLNPFRQTIEMVGRDQDLRELRDWLYSGRRIAVRVLTGRGGAGKTRIALELIEELQAAGEWKAGFISAAEVCRFAGQQNLSQWGWQSSTLAVVDYAAVSVEALRNWLSEMAEHPARGADGPPLRLLLLEREANPEQGWYQSLVPRSWSGEGVTELFDPIVPVRLRPLDRAEDRRAVLASMLRAAAEQAGDIPLTLPAPGQNDYFDRRLAEPVWEDPLTLMMAALVSRQIGVADALAFSRADLAFRLAERELDRIRGFAPPDDEAGRRLLVHLAAFAVLGGGLEQHDALEIAKEESGELGLRYPGGPGALVVRLRDALPRPDRGISAILPDIIAEALALSVFCELDNEYQLTAIRRAVQRLRRSMPACLIHMVQDFANEGHAEPLLWLRALVEMGAADDISLLVGIEEAMPLHTLALRELAADVDRLLLERISHSRLDTGDVISKKALFLNNLAARLNFLGHREEALASAEEAVELYRQLDAAHPDTFRPDLAMSLNNLSSHLSRLGHREEALQVAEEASNLYRQLAAARPDAFQAYLATSLTNLANRKGDLGCLETALAYAQEAVELFRPLAKGRPVDFLPDLSMSLNNLATCLHRLSHREKALEAAKEAVELYRQLAATHPDAHQPNLALSLNTLANCLSGTGCRNAALIAAEDASKLFRQLNSAHPNAFMPDLARSLDILANCLSELCCREEALAAEEESVELYRQLVAARPDTFLPNLARSLNNLAVFMNAQAHREDALLTAEEAVQIHRELTAARPNIFRPGLAMSLNNLANLLIELGRCEKALAAANESVQIRRDLTAARPDTFLPDLAKSLGTAGKSLIGLERYDEAAQSFRDGIFAMQPLFQRIPQACADVMVRLCRDYLQATMRAGIEPDVKVLPMLQAVETQMKDAGQAQE